MSRHNADVLKAHAVRTAPIAYLGRHTLRAPESVRFLLFSLEFFFSFVCLDLGVVAQKAETEPLAVAWDELWLDIVPGTEAGVRLYLAEIVAYLQRAITSKAWRLKAQAGAAVGSLAPSLRRLAAPDQRAALLRLLLDGLQGSFSFFFFFFFFV